MQSTISILKRNCGYPVAGGLYLTVPTDSEKGGFFGNPIWNNVLCTPAPLHADFKISYLGMQCISRGVHNQKGQEIFDIWDWIGHTNYPNVLDWILEVSKQGFHQLIEKSFEFNKLTPESYYYAVHSQAGINDPGIYFKQRLETEFPVCPQRHDDHINLENDWIKNNLETCSGLYSNDIVQGDPVAGRKVLRKNASFEYEAYSPPLSRKTQDKDSHYPAVFFRVPIGKIGSFTIYEDTANNTHQYALDKLKDIDARLKKIRLVKL